MAKPMSACACVCVWASVNECVCVSVSVCRAGRRAIPVQLVLTHGELTVRCTRRRPGERLRVRNGCRAPPARHPCSFTGTPAKTHPPPSAATDTVRNQFETRKLDRILAPVLGPPGGPKTPTAKGEPRQCWFTCCPGGFGAAWRTRKGGRLEDLLVGPANWK